MTALPAIIRWTPERKRDLVRKIERGEVSREQAIQQYRLTEDEIAAWKRMPDTRRRRR